LNKTVLIAGSTKGIGLEIARKFHQSNWNVIITSRSNIEIESLKFSNKEQSTLKHFKVDFTKQNEVLWLKQHLVANKTPIDCLISNVGLSSGMKGLNSKFQENMHLLDTNLISVLRTLNLVNDLVVKSENSRIIVIGSVAGKVRVGAPINYSASKAALVSVVKYYAPKFAKFGISINLVNPGHTITKSGIWSKKIEENPLAVFEIVKSNVPMNRLGTATEIAEFIFQIVNSKSNYLTGTQIDYDGGLVISR
jgi:NAD(P)-dependent dehydrogenase (short-subunit alcohol dehydrogenase family)